VNNGEGFFCGRKERRRIRKEENRIGGKMGKKIYTY